MRFLLTLLLVFSLSSPIHAQTPSEAEPNVEDLLISANSKKALAAREIAQSPNRVAGELARVMAGMDRLFQEQVQERFDAHYKKVEQSLQTVSLPEDVVPWKSSGSRPRQECMIRATLMPCLKASSAGRRPRLNHNKRNWLGILTVSSRRH